MTNLFNVRFVFVLAFILFPFCLNAQNDDQVSGWRRNGAVISDNASNTYTLTNLSANVTVTVTFEKITTTGAEESFAPDLNIYPNPFTGEIRVETGEAGEIGEAGEVVLRVIDAAGVVVHTQKMTSPDEMIRLGHLPAGVYFFIIEKEGKVKTVKVIKN